MSNERTWRYPVGATCPGGDIRITIRDCPFCGEEVEFFTGDTRVKCSGCSRMVPRDPSSLSCLDWCPAASQCFDARYGEKSGPEAATDGP